MVNVNMRKKNKKGAKAPKDLIETTA